MQILANTISKDLDQDRRTETMFKTELTQHGMYKGWQKISQHVANGICIPKEN